MVCSRDSRISFAELVTLRTGRVTLRPGGAYHGSYPCGIGAAVLRSIPPADYLDGPDRRSQTRLSFPIRRNLFEPDLRPAIGAWINFEPVSDAGIILFPIRVHAPTQTCRFQSCALRGKLSMMSLRILWGGVALFACALPPLKADTTLASAWMASPSTIPSTTLVGSQTSIWRRVTDSAFPYARLLPVPCRA
jgi:hypothetical protein